MHNKGEPNGHAQACPFGSPLLPSIKNSDYLPQQLETSLGVLCIKNIHA